MPAEIKVESNQQPDAPASSGPFSADQIVPTLIIVAIAILGGLLNFRQKVKKGITRWLNINELIGALFMSAGCGLFAYWVFKGLGVNEWFTAAGVGIVGHMGSRAIFMLEEVAKQWVERQFGVQVKEQPDLTDTNVNEGRN